MSEPARQLGPYDTEQDGGGIKPPRPKLGVVQGANEGGGKKSSEAGLHVVGGKKGKKESDKEGGKSGIGDAASKAKKATNFVFNPEGAAAKSTFQKAKDALVGGKKEKKRSVIVTLSVIAGVALGLGFLAELPYEVIPLTQSLQNHLLAGVSENMTLESDRLASDYARDRMERSLGLRCKNLRTCVKNAKAVFGKCKEADNVCKMFREWDNSDLLGQFEEKGITFSKEGDTWFIHSGAIPEGKLDVTEVVRDKNANLFEFAEKKIPGFGDTLREIKEATIVSKGSYFHNIFTKLFRVLWTGDGKGTRVKDKDTTDAQKADAFQGADTLTTDVAAADVAVAAECLADQKCAPEKTNPGTGDAAQDQTAGQPESDTRVEMNQAEEAAVSKFGSKKLGALLKSYADLKAKGKNALADAIANAISGATGADLSKEATRELIDKLGGVEAIVQISAQVLNFAHSEGNKLKALYFMVHYGPDIVRASEFLAESDKERSGCYDNNGECQNDLTMIGSFARALHNKGANATDSSYVNHVINGNYDEQSTETIHSDLAFRHLALNGYSNPITQLTSFANKIPFFGTLVGFVNILNSIIGAIAFLPNLLIQTIIHATHLDAISGKVLSALLIWITYHALPVGGIIDPRGDDLGSTIGIGIHLMAWTAGDAIGGKRLTPLQAATLSNMHLDAQHRSFEQRPLFARIFAKDTQYSLVSQISLKLPSSFGDLFQGSFTSLLQNPLNKTLGSIASIFHPGSVFAAATPEKSPDGVWENGLPADDPLYTTNSETYQNEHHCVPQSKKDYPHWNAHIATDPDTQQIYHTQTEGCLTQQRAMEGMGILNGYSD